MQIYKVGGAVRDRLLGQKVKDCDWVVVGGTPEAMTRLGYRPVGKDFPVFLHPETQQEYALARTERKAGTGYKGFTVFADPSVTLEQDLARRDLTINAMAEDADGRLIDPYNGQTDLQAGILRHVSPAFVEDPLRVLRVARFAARLNFRVATETLSLMQQISASGELTALTPERAWQEIGRALADPHPRRFIEVLRDCGALAVLLPELDRLFGVPQRADYHPEIDTGVHTLMVLEQAARLSPLACVRFAALTHDLGKGTTPADILPRHHGHEARSVELVNAVCARYRAPNDFRELAVLVARYHGNVHRLFELRAETLLDLLESCDAFRRPDRFEHFILACEADARGRLGLERQPYAQADWLRAAHRAADAVDTAAISAADYRGVEYGQELRRRRLQLLKEMKQHNRV